MSFSHSAFSFYDLFLPFFFYSYSSNNCLKRGYPASHHKLRAGHLLLSNEAENRASVALLPLLRAQKPLPWECCRELPSPPTNRLLVNAGNLACCLGDAAGTKSRFGAVCVPLCVGKAESPHSRDTKNKIAASSFFRKMENLTTLIVPRFTRVVSANHPLLVTQMSLLIVFWQP